MSFQHVEANAYLNNTCDFDEVDHILHKGMDRSFKTLVKKHTNRIDYREYDYPDVASSKKINKFYLNRDGVACIDIKDDIIIATRRQAYHNSRLYQQNITAMDIASNPNIFSHFPVVVVDDYKCIWDYQIRIYAGYFTILLPFDHTFMDTPNHKIHVKLIKGAIYKRFELTDATIRNAFITSGRLDIPVSVLKSLFGSFTSTDMTIGSISATVSGKVAYSPMAMSNASSSTYSINLKYTDGTRTWKEFSSAKTISLHILKIPKLFKLSQKLASTTGSRTGWGILSIFQDAANRTLYKLPIPSKNLFLVKTNTAGEYSIPQGNHVLSLKYPNLYEVSGSLSKSDIFDVYYFYDEYTSDPSYNNIFASFFHHLGGLTTNIASALAGLYTNATAWQAKPYLRQIFMSMLDYAYDALPVYDELKYTGKNGSDRVTAIESKLSSAETMMRADASLMEEYMEEQAKSRFKVYRMWAKDYTFERRMTPLNEVGIDDVFDEEHVMVKLANRNDTPLNLRVFVDGLLIGEAEHYHHRFVDYIYIPASKVKENSFIEIESFPVCVIRSQPIKFTSLNDRVTISLDDMPIDIIPTARDIIYASITPEYREKHPSLEVPISNGPVRLYTDLSDYDFAMTHSIMDNKYLPIEGNYLFTAGHLVFRNLFFSLAPDPFEVDVDYKGTVTTINRKRDNSNIRTFTIRPNDEYGLNDEFTLCFAKVLGGKDYKLVEDCHPSIPIPVRNFNNSESLGTDPDSYIRVFLNGHLLNRTEYRVSTGFNNTRVAISQKCHVGDHVFVDLSPYRYREIINVNMTDFYDIGNYATEQTASGIRVATIKNLPNNIGCLVPFSLTTHDIYIGDVRASVNNFFKISPWDFVFKSTTNTPTIRVYAKERDPEYFYFDSETEEYFGVGDMLTKSGSDSKSAILNPLVEKNKDSHITLRNMQNAGGVAPIPNPESYTEWDESVFFEQELLGMNYINPDYLQLNRGLFKEEFPSMLSDVILPEEGRPQIPVYFLDPNASFAVADKPDGVVYCLSSDKGEGDDMYVMLPPQSKLINI